MKTNIMAATRAHHGSPNSRPFTGSKVAMVTILFGLAWMAPSEAAPIVYTFSGIGSGSAGGLPFDNVPFTINAYADTAYVSHSGSLNDVETALSTVTIAGIGSGTFTEATTVGSAFNGYLPVVSFMSGADLWFFYLPYSPANASYDLTTAFGPVGPVGVFSGGGALSSVPQPTTLGDLTLSSWSNDTFTATLVPEPDAVVLCSIASLVFALRFPRNTKQKLD